MRLEGVGKRYRVTGPWVLTDVELELHPGELIRAHGVNGSGKSTLLRIVAGACAPSRGAVRGRPGRAAYVPERFAAGLPFRVCEYLGHLGRLHGLAPGEADRRAVALLERFRAAGFADQPLAELSKGTSQKVAVVQALLGEPELLVLDEAWTGLDQEARAELDAAVLERVAEGAAAVYVDHDPARLAGLARQVWHVAEGSVRAEETGAAGALTLRQVVVRGVADATADRLPQAVPGVLRTEHRPDGTVAVVVARDDTEALLRVLLADPGVRVEAVR